MRSALQRRDEAVDRRRPCSPASAAQVAEHLGEPSSSCSSSARPDPRSKMPFGGPPAVRALERELPAVLGGLAPAQRLDQVGLAAGADVQPARPERLGRSHGSGRPRSSGRSGRTIRRTECLCWRCGRSSRFPDTTSVSARRRRTLSVLRVLLSVRLRLEAIWPATLGEPRSRGLRHVRNPTTDLSRRPGDRSAVLRPQAAARPGQPLGQGIRSSRTRSRATTTDEDAERPAIAPSTADAGTAQRHRAPEAAPARPPSVSRPRSDPSTARSAPGRTDVAMAQVLRPIGHEDRLSIVDHLDELRSRLIICGRSLMVAFGFCFWQNHALLNILNKPLPRASSAADQHGLAAAADRGGQGARRVRRTRRRRIPRSPPRPQLTARQSAQQYARSRRRVLRRRRKALPRPPPRRRSRSRSGSASRSRRR